MDKIREAFEKMDSINIDPKWSNYNPADPEDYLFLIFKAGVLSNIPQLTEWISVEDRLPEVLVNVLVCGVEEDCYTVAYRNRNAWFPITDLLVAENYDGNAVIEVDGCITHWMPLPPPPVDYEVKR